MADPDKTEKLVQGYLDLHRLAMMKINADGKLNLDENGKAQLAAGIVQAVAQTRSAEMICRYVSGLRSH